MKKLLLLLLTVGSLFAIDYRVLEKDTIPVSFPYNDIKLSYVCIDNLVYLTGTSGRQGYMSSVQDSQYPLRCSNFQKFITKQR